MAMDFHFATAFEQIADAVPNEPALICGDAIRSWSEFDDPTNEAAGMLTALAPRRIWLAHDGEPRDAATLAPPPSPQT